MRAFFFLTLCQVLFTAAALGYPMTPDADETPGSVCTTSNDDFDEYRYPEKIPYCGRNVASSLKKEIYEWYGISESERKDYTIDHLIPLSIGGDNDRRNLWPEHKEVKATRPDLEMKLYKQLRDAKIKQKIAIERILEVKFNPEQNTLRLRYRLKPVSPMQWMETGY